MQARRLLAAAARPILLLAGIVLLLVLELPRIVAPGDLGAWRYVVTAAGNREFRDERSFRSRGDCEAARAGVAQDLAQALTMESAGTRVGALARRLQLGPCQAVRAGG